MCSKHVVNNCIFLVPLTPLTSCPTVPAFCSLIILGLVLGFSPPAIQQIVSVWRGISCCKLLTAQMWYPFCFFLLFSVSLSPIECMGVCRSKKGTNRKTKSRKRNWSFTLSVSGNPIFKTLFTGPLCSVFLHTCSSALCFPCLFPPFSVLFISACVR